MDTQTPAASTAAAGGIYVPNPAATQNIPCLLSYVTIPNGSDNGIAPLNSVISGLAFQNEWCGADLGYTGTTATPVSIVCKSSIRTGHQTSGMSLYILCKYYSGIKIQFEIQFINREGFLVRKKIKEGKIRGQFSLFLHN